MGATIRRIRSVLMDDWDPIGVQGIAEGTDDYDSYALSIYSILRQRRSEDALLDYLSWMSEHMGLPASPDSLRTIASKLIQIDLSQDERYQ